MEYVGTRGDTRPLPFDDVLLDGMAADGGLFVPRTWPQFSADDIAALGDLPYDEAAARIMAPFVGDAIPAEKFRALVSQSYAEFGHQSVAPLRQIGPGEWLLELFHGPTLAFKDIALQLLGRLFDHLLDARGRRATIVGATSGDTGSAAIAACGGRANMDVFILHPRGLVSDVQRRQMTTVGDDNVHNIAVEGTFDDCQALVKTTFADEEFRRAHHLSAVNSINWARVMAQTVYYFTAAASLGAPGTRVSFAVPTGNFGDVYAGYTAHRMGLPIGLLVVATNVNDILTRFLASGAYRPGAVSKTLSPSMDIQVASNFERLLFELVGRDGTKVAALMAELREKGVFTVPSAALSTVAGLFAAHRLDDAGTVAEIARVNDATGILIDPHTAIGVNAGRREAARPMVALATAHPAKFPEAVEQAAGRPPTLPDRLKNIFDRRERYEVLPNSREALQEFIRQRARA